MPKDQVNEHIKKIMSKSNYVLESPSYKAIIDDDFNTYDEPNTYMGGPSPVDGNSSLREEDPIPGEEEEQPVGDIEMDALGMDGTEVPAPEMGGEPEIPDEVPSPEMGDEAIPTEEPPMEAPVEAQPNPDELQNDIIKKNIEVMKQLNQKIDSLEAGIDNLSMQNQELSFKSEEMAKDVEEVREPTNVEKLMSKKVDSHPYYYGLNDMWDGNWFQGRRDELGDRGMKQMDDGSYVADFDEMNQLNDIEIKDSFDK